MPARAQTVQRHKAVACHPTVMQLSPQCQRTDIYPHRRNGDNMGRPFIDFALLARATNETRTYKAGEVIFSAGDEGHEFFVVKSGKVGVRLRNRTLDTMGEGEVFGEMALIDSEPRSASAVAETDCVVVPVSEKQFLFMTSEAPYFALSLMRVLAQRLRTANTALPDT
jgi:CRP-like cAMP-binding protein